MKHFLICCTLLIGLGSAAKIRELPSFFKTCKSNEPDLRACILEKSKLSLPGILKGVKEFKVPTFLPLRLKEVKVNAGNVILKLSDFDMYGLDSTELVDARMQMDKNYGSATLHIDQLQINGTYDIDGKILVLPITGHGPGFLQFDKLVIQVEIGYELNEMPEDKQYHFMKVTTLNINYTAEHALFKFDNLFNGDKKLGEEMNIFLNENWSEFEKDVRPAIISVIETVVLQISKGILEMVPMEKMFPK